MFMKNNKRFTWSEAGVCLPILPLVAPAFGSVGKKSKKHKVNKQTGGNAVHYHPFMNASHCEGIFFSPPKHMAING